jgi:hypothetical protein
VIEDIRTMLAELAAHGEQVERDEQRILEAAQRRLSELPDGSGAEAERAILKHVIARAEAALALRSGS